MKFQTNSLSRLTFLLCLVVFALLPAFVHNVKIADQLRDPEMESAVDYEASSSGEQ